MIYYFVYNLGSYSGAAQQALKIAKEIGYDITICNIGTPYFSEVFSNVKILNLHKFRFLEYFNY